MPSIVSIDTSKAKAHPGVHAVLTAEDLKPLKLHWMPTLAGDVQAVLADGKVSFQNQEVAFVVADDRYIAADAAELVEVEYEELPAWSIPSRRLTPDAPVIRPDLAGKDVGAHGKRRKHHNHIFNWQIGDKDKTDRAFAAVPKSPSNRTCSIRACILARWKPAARSPATMPVRGDLTVWITSRRRMWCARWSASALQHSGIENPHHLARYRRRLRQTRSAVYPGYVIAIVASIVLGRPVKWIESRSENLTTTAFARDYWMTGELAADTATAKSRRLRVNVTADHGAFDACADPTKWPAGMFHVCTGSYDIPTPMCRSMASTPPSSRAAFPIAAPSV